MSPGLQQQYQVHSLSIHIKRETVFTNAGVCVHMSLNNNSINIQCFHYCQQRRASESQMRWWRPQRTKEKLLRCHVTYHFMGNRLTCEVFPFSSRLISTEEAACLIHESKQEGSVGFTGEKSIITVLLIVNCLYFTYLINKLDLWP